MNSLQKFQNILILKYLVKKNYTSYCIVFDHFRLFCMGLTILFFRDVFIGKTWRVSYLIKKPFY